MLEWIQNTLESLGYFGIAFLTFLENIVPPIPSELILPASGYAAARGNLTLWGVIVAATLGSVMGAIPLYYLGYWLGKDRLVAWFDRYGKWLTVSGKDITHSVEWFEQHGVKAVLLARVIPGVRSLISIPAGISRMNLPLFLLYSALGSSVWNTLLVTLGFALGENYEQVEKFVGPISKYIFIGLGVALVLWLVWRSRRQAGKAEG